VQDDRVTIVRALVFDVFGTVVDWRSGVLAEARDIESRTGVRADWDAVVDDWRRAYGPSLLEARRASAWRDLDALHQESLGPAQE
jgi:2-haloacid dehalogenase